MAKGEGDQGLRSHFVERVVKLPIVHVAWGYASNTYSHIKESNKLVNFTLTNAEKTATFVAGQAKPVVLKFEKQIQAVDSLACKGLGTLEEKVPFITKPAEEIIGETRKRYTDSLNSRLQGIKQYGNDKVKTAAQFGMRRATAIFGETAVQSVLTSVDGVLVLTQSYIDHLLPPAKGENISNGKKEEADNQKGLVRVVQIVNTVRRRTYRTFVVQLEYAQEKTLDLLLTYPFRMIEFSKTHLDSAIEYANKLWAAIRQHEVDETNENEKNKMETQLLQLARVVSKQVATAYSSFTTSERAGESGQEPSQAPAVAIAVRDGVMWALGMIKLIPQLLPMYIYGLASWLEQLRESKQDPIQSQGTKTNGVVSKDENHSVDQNHSNHVHKNSFSSDESIPEEDEGEQH